MMEFAIFTILFGLVPFLLFLAIKNKLSNTINATLPLIILIFISSIYEFVFTLVFKLNIKFWFITYNFFAFIIISYFYFRILSSKFKIYIKFWNIFYIGLMIILIFNYSKYETIVLSSYMDTFQTLFILTFSILWFGKVFNDLKYDDLLDSSFFYFISGLIIYYCGTLILFLMSNIIYQDDKSMLQYYWILNIILNLILRTLLIVGIWKARVK